jgi:hypothetical protein
MRRLKSKAGAMLKATGWIVAVFGGFLLGGCATNDGQIERAATFTSASRSSLFVLGVDVQGSFRHPKLTLVQYDSRTGKVIAGSARSVEPRTDQVPVGTKLGAAVLGGRQTLPTGRSLFVFELPPGDWLLWSVSARVSGYSSDTTLAPGTIALRGRPGGAAYIGEFEIQGDIGENLQLTELPRRFDKSRADLASFPNIQVPLDNVEPELREFTCERNKPRSPCSQEKAVVSVPRKII